MSATTDKTKRLGPARESWLRSDDPDRYAAAMMKCQHGDPSFCSSDGHCHRGGCFGRERERIHCAECKGRGWLYPEEVKP